MTTKRTAAKTRTAGRAEILLVLGLTSLGLGARSRRPNVLFIISDDLTTTALSCYKSPAGKTPNIDRLAAQGMRYTRAFCQFPVCGPSRASFMSGYYPHATGTMGYVSGRKNIGDRATWSQYFIQHGYYVARVSKIFHMGVPGDIERGANGADDEPSWMERFNSQGPEWRSPGQGELLEKNPEGTKPVKGGNTLEYVQADGADWVQADGKTTRRACALLREHGHGDRPFFLAVGFVRPHVPFVAPRAYFEPYDWNRIVLPPKIPGDWNDIPAAGINYRTSKNMQLNRDQEQKAVAAYYASVSFMDAQVGRVLETLRAEGLEDDTIVIFTSDHGFHLCEHDFWMKVGLMDESSRVPLIIKVPGKRPGVCRSFAELLDLYPTVAELCGLVVPARLQGRSLVGTLDDPSVSVRDAAFCVNSKSFLLRTDRWAYIQHGRRGELGLQLYDMRVDPGQYTNLARDPNHAETVAALRERLEAKLAAVHDNDLGDVRAARDTATTEPSGAFLFTSFRGNGEDGLHLAYSRDGLAWTALGRDRSFLRPTVGGRLMRDPCVIQGPDRQFHMVWTTSWTDRGIGLAHSPDLVNWSAEQFVPVMAHEPTARNCWAPEITWDPEGRQYVIYWATTIPGRFPQTEATGDGDASARWNHRLYATTTRDFQTFTETRLLYEPGFNVIDGTILRRDDGYVMVLKDETRYPPAKHLRLAFSDRITGPWSPAGPAFSPAGLWVEGPTGVRNGGFWYVYFDAYRQHRYGVLRSADLKTWEDLTDRLRLPEGTRHGTVLRVSEATLSGLLQAEAGSASRSGASAPAAF